MAREEFLHDIEIVITNRKEQIQTLKPTTEIIEK